MICYCRRKIPHFGRNGFPWRSWLGQTLAFRGRGFETHFPYGMGCDDKIWREQISRRVRSVFRRFVFHAIAFSFNDDDLTVMQDSVR
jgi:hypothetical protein